MNDSDAALPLEAALDPSPEREPLIATPAEPVFQAPLPGLDGPPSPIEGTTPPIESLWIRMGREVSHG